MDSVIKLESTNMVPHPPYQDPDLQGEIGNVYVSSDGCFKAVYWRAWGGGVLLENPQFDELICVLEGHARVDTGCTEEDVGPGDVIVWRANDPPRITVVERLLAFCVVYKPSDPPKV